MSLTMDNPNDDDNNYTKLLDYLKTIYHTIRNDNNELQDFVKKWGERGIVSAYMDRHNILKYADAGGTENPPRELPKCIDDIIMGLCSLFLLELISPKYLSSFGVKKFLQLK
jgi:hypothetical protein